MHEKLGVSLRVFARHPAFSAAVVLSLAIGISSAAGTFAIVESAHYGALPFANAPRLEHVYLGRRSHPDERRWEVPTSVMRALESPDSPIEALAAYQMTPIRVRHDDRSASTWGHLVTDNLPAVLGARAALGRLFDSAQVSNAPVVVLSYDFWQSEFAGDSAVVGKSIEVNGQFRVVVGVVSRATWFPEQSVLWESGFRPTASGARQAGLLALIHAGVPPEAARPRIRSLGAAVLSGETRASRDLVLDSTPLREYLLSGRMTQVLLIMSVIAMLVGLIAAVNYAALILARGIRRRAEIGVRAALGASVPRLAQHIVGESLLLCAMGGTLGAVLAPLVVNRLRAAFGFALPAWLDITLGWRTVVASIILAIVVGVVFGLGPALDVARPALTGFLRGAGNTVSDGAGLARLRSRLVAIQVALATGVLVALGAVLGRSLALTQPSPGFDASAIVRGSVLDSGSMKGAAPAERMNRVFAAARQAPGVAGAAFRELEYLKPSAIAVEADHGPVEADGAGFVWINRVGSGFFDVMRPRLLAGRFPTEDELVRGEPVVVVSRIVASDMYDDRAVGRRFWLNGIGGTALEVIGVVDDVREHGYQADAPYVVFVPLAAGSFGGVASRREIWIRYGTYVPTALTALRPRLSAGQLGGVEVAELEPMIARIQRELASFRRVAAIVLGIFAVAMLLAALGIYGLVAYTAEMRSREFAIREALGATRLHIAARVLRGAVAQSLAGVLAGAVIATLIVEQLNGYQLRITAAAGTSAIALGVVVVTVMIASFGPIISAWRRDLSATLRVNG
jgi:predicted permease